MKTIASLKRRCSTALPAVWLAAVRMCNIVRALAARMRYGRPAHRIRLVGVTGTNGKTTTATLLWQLFESMGYKCGLISTVTYRIHDKEAAAEQTTPSLLHINRLLSEMVRAGCKYCFMEVSSHAVVQRRIQGLRFAGGIFTNITHDHLDYHSTFAGYIKAKKAFFDHLPPDAFAITNMDDPNGAAMVSSTRARCHTYALNRAADYYCRILEQQLEGTRLNINGKELWSPLIGAFNAYNICAVYGAANLLMELPTSPHNPFSTGEEEQSDLSDDVHLRGNSPLPCGEGGKGGGVELASHISKLTGARGRFERIASPKGAVGVIDYAHTPDALQNVIHTINQLLGSSAGDGRASDKRGSLIVVVGCGGDRDRTKRPLMAQIAVRSGGRAILTSDNPRTEQPQAILDDMVKGLTAAEAGSVEVIPDRRAAIQRAAALAGRGDIILIAGKGHEDYQIVGAAKHHFDDKEELIKAFNGE